MSRSSVFRAVVHCFRTLSLVVVDLVRLARLAAHSHGALAAESLFLRKQLAMFQERKVKGQEQVLVARSSYLIRSAGLHISIVLPKHNAVNMFGE